MVRTWDLELEPSVDLISCWAIYYLRNLKQIYLFSLSTNIYVPRAGVQWFSLINLLTSLSLFLSSVNWS